MTLGPVTLWEVAGFIATVVATVFVYRSSASDRRKEYASITATTAATMTILLSIAYDRVPQIEEDIAVFRDLRNNSNAMHFVDHLAEAESAARTNNAKLFREVLESKLSTWSKSLEELERGRFVLSRDEMPIFAIKLIESAESSFNATSYVSFEQWWNTSWGKKYLDLNYAAIEKGVTVRRTFIFSDRKAFEAARNFVAEQEAKGIEVTVAFADALSDVQVTSDMLVIDGSLAGELALSPDKGMREATFYTGEKDIRDINDRIERLRAVAFSLKDIAPNTPNGDSKE